MAEKEFNYQGDMDKGMNRADSSKDEMETAEHNPSGQSKIERDDIFERITDGFLSLDSEWRFTYLNSAGAKILGRTSEDLIGKNLWKEFPNLAETEFGKTYLRAVEEKVPLSYEGYYTPFDAWFNARAYPSEIGLSIFFLDITDRKKTQDSSRKVANQLKSFADPLPVLLSYVDNEERYRFVNKGYVEWLGATQEEIVGKQIRDIVGETYYQAVAPKIKKVMSGEEVTFEQILPYTNDIERFIHVNYVPDFDRETGNVRGFYALVQDISERKLEERDREFLLELGEKIRFGGFSPEKLLDYVTEATSRYLNTARCLFIEVFEAENKGVVRHESCRKGVASVGGEYSISDYNPEMLKDIKLGRILVNDDAANDPRTAEIYKTVYEPYNELSYISIPLFTDGRWTAIFWVSDSQPRHWTKREITFLETIGERVWLAIEKLRKDQALRFSEERLRLATEAAKIYAWEIDTVARQTHYADNAERVLGFKMPDSLDQSIAIIHEDDRQLVAERIAQAIASESNLEIDFRIMNPHTGAMVWQSAKGVFVKGIGKEADRLVGITENITERKHAELNARFLAEISQDFTQISSEAALSTMVGEKLYQYLNTSAIAFIEVNADRTEVAINNEWHRGDTVSLIGNYLLSEFISEEFHHSVSVGKAVIIRDIDTDPRVIDKKRFRALGIGSHINMPLIKDGIWKFALGLYHTEAYNWRDDEIELIRELTLRTWTVIERIRAEERLRDSEEKYRNLSNAMPQLVWTADSEGVVDYYNSLAANYEGINFNEATQVWTWEPVVHSDELDSTINAWNEAQRTGRYEVEHRIKMADGAYRWHLSRAVAATDSEKGRIIKWFGTATDIHLLKLAEADRERLLQSEHTARLQAEEANRLKDEFLATVSHELRTPLNAILGWSTMARGASFDTRTANHAFEVIERNARNQNQIIADLLDVSRIITGKLNLDIRAVELIPIIQSAIDTVRPALQAKNIKLMNDFDFADLRVKGDSNRLQQVIWNLISNAVKFTPEDGQINITLEYSENLAEIRVTDSGAGIESEFLPFVFDRFRQADAGSNRKHGGLGLGLSIVKHLVEMHGGNVSVQSEGTGNGATFTIKLPLDAKRAQTIPESNLQAEKTTENNTPLKGLNILVVDDEIDALELIEIILSKYGAKVISANSTVDALRKLDGEVPDLIVSDIGMPERDGYDLIRTIRNLPDDNISKIPAIALTAYARTEDGQRMLATGYQAHLPKPVETERLVEVIKGLIKVNRD